MKKSLLMAAAVFCSLGLATNAYANGCDDLDNNPEWKLTLQMLHQDIQYKNYDAALAKADQLSAICEDSPTLNYAIARIYEQKGDFDNQKAYLKKATHKTQEYPVDAATLDAMWENRVFAEHPDSAPDNVKKLQADLSKAQAELKVVGNNPESSLAVEIGLWSSVGVGSAGVLFSLIGGIMVAAMDSPVKMDPDDPDRVIIERKYGAAWGLVGAGIAMAITGAAGAGYFGYRYTQNNHVSLQLSPTGVGISGTF